MDKLGKCRSLPSVSVVICTRNRPSDIDRCLDSLTLVDYPAWSVMVIDQSEGADTHRIVERFADRLPRLDYVRAEERGLSRARNIGAARSNADIIGFLDDDCTVSADWLMRVAEAFERHRQAALVFGRVVAAPHDPTLSIIPSFEITSERVFHGRAAFVANGGQYSGIGAAMYARMAYMRRVGGFDVCLGAGAGYFEGGEEQDYAQRCLNKGYEIVESPSIAVTHHGARSYTGGVSSRLLRGYAHADGGMLMKFIRMGDPVGVALVVMHLWNYASWINFGNIITRRGPSGAARLIWYLRGLAASFRLGVDREHSVYRPTESDGARKADITRGGSKAVD